MSLTWKWKICDLYTAHYFKIFFVFQLAFCLCFSSDRFRTTNNLLGDCYTAAVVEVWSRDALDIMDSEVVSSNSIETEKIDLGDPDMRHLLLGGGVREFLVLWSSSGL